MRSSPPAPKRKVVPSKGRLESGNLVTPKEAANALRIPLPTVYYLIKQGKIPAMRVGGRWRIEWGKLDPRRINGPVTSVRRVLAVDDDPAIHELFHLAARQVEGTVKVASSRQEALEFVKKERFDLVLLDLFLPDGRGDIAYEEIHEMNPTLPVVVITGYPDSDVLHRILAHGPVTVLSKPLRVEQVGEAIRKFARPRD